MVRLSDSILRGPRVESHTQPPRRPRIEESAIHQSRWWPATLNANEQVNPDAANGTDCQTPNPAARVERLVRRLLRFVMLPFCFLRFIGLARKNEPLAAATQNTVPVHHYYQIRQIEGKNILTLRPLDDFVRGLSPEQAQACSDHLGFPQEGFSPTS